MISRRISYSVIIVIVFIAYAPVLHSGICSLDDASMLQSLRKLKDWDFLRHFFPERNEGLYYRPLLTMTYVFDRFLWDTSALVMHFENLLLHLINALLVFEVTRLLLPQNRDEPSRLPLLAALLFGLHPLNVESVAWISGRTDLLCATFVFLSAIFILKFKRQGRRWYLLAALAALFLGFMCKEVAIAFLPGAALLIFARDEETPPSSTRKTLKKTAFMLVGVVAIFFVYYLVRDIATSNYSPRIGITLSVIFNDLYYAFFVCLRAFGFYIKKIFLPFPLNFAIVSVDPLYELLAMPLVALCLWLATRRTLRASLFIAGLCLLTPAFLIAFGQVAWTHYAERYLYLPLGFVLPAIVCYLGQKVSLFSQQKRTLVAVLSVVLLIGMGGAVFHRSYVWRSDLRLLADTTAKSPLAKRSWNVYGAVLYEAGEYEKALESFEKASALNGFDYKVIYDTNRAATLEALGREDEAIELLRQVVQTRRGDMRVAYDSLISLLELKIGQTDDDLSNQQLRQEIDGYKISMGH